MAGAAPFDPGADLQALRSGKVPTPPTTAAPVGADPQADLAALRAGKLPQAPAASPTERPPGTPRAAGGAPPVLPPAGSPFDGRFNTTLTPGEEQRFQQ